MLEERRAKIVEKLQHQKTIKVKALTDQFDVSIETIRRDLEYLEKEGYLKRVYGGAIRPEGFSVEPSFTNREVKNLDIKKAIAQKAVDLIDDGDTVFFDIGTTCLEVAKLLGAKKNLHIITNSLMVANEVTHYPTFRITLLGGQIRNGEQSLSGPITNDNLRLFNADKAIIGAGGITENLVLSDYHIEEAAVRAKMIEGAKYSIVLCDSSKIGVTCMCNICTLDKLGVLITDHAIPRNLLHAIENLPLPVILA